MCPHLQRDPAGRHFPEYRIPSARRGCHRSFTGDFSHFVQDAVAAGAVPQVDPYRESLLRGCSPFSFRLRGRLLLVLDGDILFHKPVSFCTSSSASIWELTAPCGRPAFSFHLSCPNRVSIGSDAAFPTAPAHLGLQSPTAALNAVLLPLSMRR